MPRKGLPRDAKLKRMGEVVDHQGRTIAKKRTYKSTSEPLLTAKAGRPSGPETKTHRVTKVVTPALVDAITPATPEWEDIVTELRKLSGKGRMWRAGDAALRVAPMGDIGQHNDAMRRLAQLATEADMHPGLLRVYRETAHAWPMSERLDHNDASWSVHQMLNAVPGKAGVLAQLVQEAQAQHLRKVTIALTESWIESHKATLPERALRDITAGATGKAKPSKAGYKPSLQVRPIDVDKAGGKALLSVQEFIDKMKAVKRARMTDREQWESTVDRLADAVTECRQVLNAGR